MTTSDSPDVLIVGGSLVGLSAAVLLRLHGVDCLAVERHTGTAIHPRAGHFQLRTVEILRSARAGGGGAAQGRGALHPDGGINNVESLAGREIASYFPNLNAGVDEFSPTVRLFVNQDDLEPILRARAEDLGAKLRYRAECTSLEQDPRVSTPTRSARCCGPSTSSAPGRNSRAARWHRRRTSRSKTARSTR
jgi:2-polyprenyl-6-methoxyphenol hydroxylase-like FAD-dependent oxidoreductase